MALVYPAGTLLVLPSVSLCYSSPQFIQWAVFGEGEPCADRKPTALHFKFNVSQPK